MSEAAGADADSAGASTVAGSTVVWAGWPKAPAPIAAVLAASRPVRVVDGGGNPIPFGAWATFRESVRGVWLRVLDLVLGAAAGLLAGRADPPVRAASRAGPVGTGPTVIVLPVLPDLSHTFVYREVLAMLRQRPDWRVVVLARNPGAPVHAEAAELEKVATFLPADGITRRAARVLGWLLRRNGRELFALYRAQPGGSVRHLLGKNPLRDRRHPGNAFALADLLAPLAPRHLHVYSSTYPANVAVGAAHLLELPVSISSYVDFEFPYAHRMLADKLARARFFRVVTAFCGERLRALHQVPAEHVPVVYLGLDLDNWQQRATPPRTGRLVSAARLVPKKGLRAVPPALAGLRKQGVEGRWRVIGDGPELPALRELCDQHGVTELVDFLGPLDNAAVRRELLGADVALLPCVVAPDGERDGIPIFLCEAMALGVPVVTTPVSGIPELVRDAETGFLCAPGDPDALAATLAKVLRDPELADRVAAAGRDEVHRSLDVDVTSRHLVERIEA